MMRSRILISHDVPSAEAEAGAGPLKKLAFRFLLLHTVNLIEYGAIVKKLTLGRFPASKSIRYGE